MSVLRSSQETRERTSQTGETTRHGETCHAQGRMLRASFGFRGRDIRPTRCQRHSFLGHEHFWKKRCIECNLCLVEKGGQACFSCRSAKKIIKREELRVELLLNLLDRDAWTHLSYRDQFLISDQIVCDQRLSECGKRKFRPDFAWILSDNAAVVVEVDEYNHRDYDTSCKRSRMLAIQEQMDRNVAIIRYDPHLGSLYGSNPEWMKKPKSWKRGDACSQEELKHARRQSKEGLKRMTNDPALSERYWEPILRRAPCPLEVRLLSLLRKTFQRMTTSLIDLDPLTVICV